MILIVVALATAVVVVITIKGRNCCLTSCPLGTVATTQPGATSQPATSSRPTGPLPRLVDLGAGKCIPCKMMAPILEELQAEYAGQLRVDVYDVWENRGLGEQYGIRMIPTQIFYDASGKELWRHEGFMSKEDILAKWKELGVDLGTSGTSATTDRE